MTTELLKQAVYALELVCYGQHPPAPEAMDAMKVIRAELTKPQVEPVAWLHHYRQVPSGGAYQQADIGEMGPYPKEGYRWVFGVPLYAVQPAVKEPLTDEWIAQFCMDVSLGYTQTEAMVRHVERAHGIKGDGND